MRERSLLRPNGNWYDLLYWLTWLCILTVFYMMAVDITTP